MDTAELKSHGPYSGLIKEFKTRRWLFNGTNIVFAALVFAQVLAQGATGQGARYVAPQNTPGSILLFPLVDTSEGNLSLVSITNTNSSQRFISGMPYREGQVDLLLRYIYSDGSVVENVSRMDAGGVYSFFAQSHAGRVHTGYLYVIARDPFTGEAIDFDFLLGSSLILDLNSQAGFGLDSIAFKALAKENNSPTGISPLGHVYSDIGKDGAFYLDGNEFSATYDSVSVPMLFEEIPGVIETELVVLTTLPVNYRIDVRIELFNNNESSFEVPMSFQVWKKSNFGAISEVAKTPNLNGVNPTGEIRTGWARIQATHAVDMTTGQAILSPGIMGCYLTRSRKGHLGCASLLVGSKARSGGVLPFLN